MGIFQRIGDIISANLNEMTENLEDPEKMLKQAIREMEQSIADVTRETAKVMANERLLARELAGNEQQALQWQNKAAQAVHSGDDELARKALVRKQEHHKLAVALKDQLTAAHDASRMLKHQLEGMKAKLAEARRSLATLSARKKAADFKKKIHTSAVLAQTSEASHDAFSKFDRLREKVEQAEAEADAMAELCGTAQPAIDTDENCSAADEIEAELQALKSK